MGLCKILLPRLRDQDETVRTLRRIRASARDQSPIAIPRAGIATGRSADPTVEANVTLIKLAWRMGPMRSFSRNWRDQDDIVRMFPPRI